LVDLLDFESEDEVPEVQIGQLHDTVVRSLVMHAVGDRLPHADHTSLEDDIGGFMKRRASLDGAQRTSQLAGLKG
jgi:hypothetical protein